MLGKKPATYILYIIYSYHYCTDFVILILIHDVKNVFYV